MPLIALGSFVVPATAAPPAFDIVVTGVNDGKTGVAVLPKIIIFQSAFAVVNTLTAGAVFIGGYSDFRGVDTGSIRSLATQSDAYSPFNFKACDSGISLGNHSIMDIWTDNFGQGEIYRTGKVSSMAAGTFTVNIDANGRGGDTVFYCAIGGDDIDIAYNNWITGTYATASKPQGILAIPVPGMAASGATSWGTGGGPVNWGFAARDYIHGTSSLTVANQGNNWSVQRTNVFGLQVDQATGAQVLGGSVTAWNDLSYTVSNAGGVGPAVIMALSGANLVCSSGEFNTDDPGFDTRIDARAIFFISTGYPTSVATQSPSGQMTLGWAIPGGTQWGFWSGEKTNGNTPPLYGARYLSNNTVLRATANINGSSTSFDTTVAVTSISDSGPVTLSWPSSDHVSRQWLWFAIGAAAVPSTADLGKGIYKLVPNKRQDTIWFDPDTEGKYLAKKPMPYGISALLGDE